MRRKVLCLIGFVLCFLIGSNSNLAADSKLDNYQWNKISKYITGRDIYGVTHDGKEFVAVGQKGLIIRSEDGFSWTRDKVGYEEDFSKIEFNGDKLAATTVSGRRFVNDKNSDNNDNNDIGEIKEWILTTEKSEPIPPSAISASDTKYISSFCKIYGFAEGQNIAVAVGESGNIFVGTKKGQKPLNNKLVFHEFSDYYREYIKRLGNSTILHIGSKSIYTNNNLFEKDIPAPYVEMINKQQVVYIPAESVVKACGGQFSYNHLTSGIEINLDNSTLNLTAGKKTAIVNGKQVNIPYPAVIKDKQIYIPINIMESVGKKVFTSNKLIVLSDVDNMYDNDTDELVLEALSQVFSNPKYQLQSLSESVVDTLVELGKQQLESGETDTGKFYLLKAIDIEPNSEIYTVLIRSNRLSEPYYIENYYQSQLYSEACKYFNEALVYNCENAALYTEMINIYCDQCWYDKAEECLNKAISLAPKGTDFKAQAAYLAKCKGPKEAIKEITVSNYKELSKALGSNRIIKVLPGNYKSSGSINNEKETGKLSVKNLTIIGVPKAGAKTINLQDSESLFDFAYSYNVSINNLELNSLNLSNCSEVSINDCKIYHGLKIWNIYDLLCTDSYIEGINDDGTYEDSMLEIHSSEQVKFDTCTMKGYTLRLGDSYEEAIKDINLYNCSLINDAGICSTWSNYVPIKEDCGYEIFMGTESWNEWRFLAAIKYIKNNGFDINYENTYDGNEEIYNDGKFLKLADKLSKLTNGSAFPSIDYIVSHDEEWNAYYDYYGFPKLKKLNIIFHVKDLVNPDIKKISELITQLKPLQNDILAYGWPVTVVLTDAENPYWSVAVADFSNNSFRKFLDSGDYGTLEDCCDIIYTYESWGTEKHASDFFNIKPKYTEKEVSKQIEDLFLTKLLSVKPNDDYGQINSIDFTVRNADGTFYITPVESFIGQGDFMHYDTDMIIKTDVITGQHYITARGTTYKLADSEQQKKHIKYKEPIFNQLVKDKRLDDKEVDRSPCKDVILFVESDRMDKELKFVFLTSHVDGTEDGYDSGQYYFQYFVGTLDIASQKVTDVKALDLVDFEEMLYKD